MTSHETAITTFRAAFWTGIPGAARSPVGGPRGRAQARFRTTYATVAKSVDAPDLGSGGQPLNKVPCRFKSGQSHAFDKPFDTRTTY